MESWAICIPYRARDVVFQLAKLTVFEVVAQSLCGIFGDKWGRRGEQLPVPTSTTASTRGPQQLGISLIVFSHSQHDSAGS